MPGTPEDAAGLLISAIRDNSPTLYLENKYLYRRLRAAGPLSLDPIPLGVAKVVREGRDVTLVTYSAGVSQGLEVAEELDKDGISVEVVDVRTLVPLDVETIVNSVRKTSRAVVLHEAAKRLGYGAEIAATIQEECFWHLDQPVVRIAAKNTPTPDQPAAGGRGDPAARGDRRDAAEGGEGLAMPADELSRGGGIMTTSTGGARRRTGRVRGGAVRRVHRADGGDGGEGEGRRHLPAPRLHPGQGAAARGRGVPHGLARRRARRQGASGTPSRTGPRRTSARRASSASCTAACPACSSGARSPSSRASAR